ncbi:MAG: hypothetical protein JWR05_333 [Mucilaginibacter sp.]|nr:hypothetical protein [Mucilaginibacter sp.]
MPISPLTNKVIAYQEVPNFDTDSCVDWAIEMIGLGHDSENVIMLAGLSKPTNYFETIAYLNNALAELGLKPKTGEDGIISYSAYIISNIADGKDVKSNLNSVDNLCSKLEIDSVIYDFSLLWWAWADLDYDKNAYPTYWENANIDNIEQLVIELAKAWLKENKAIYSL